MSRSVLDQLGLAKTVLLTTFRKDGTPVPTPVWIVRSGDELRVWSNPTAGKIKRIRSSGRVTLVPCTFRGAPLGAAVDATARLLSADEAGTVRRAIGAKYGLLGKLTTWGSAVNARGRSLPPSSLIGITLD